MTLPATLNNVIGAMTAVSTSISTQSGDVAYLRLLKTGEWVFGSEDEEIADDSIFAVSIESFFVGFQAWDDGELVGEETQPITEPPIRKSDLEDVGAEWKPIIGFQLLGVSGTDKGLQLVYKTTSKGGIREVNQLMKDIVAHVTGNSHDDKLIPLVQLGVDSYKHKKYGKIYTPILEIADWIGALPNDLSPQAQAEAPAQEEVDEQDEDENVEAEQEEQPARRRRRRA